MEFPPTLVINLDERKDRWEGIQKSFAGWPTPLQRISAVKASPGWKGCFMSHLKCIEIARDNNYEWVVLLEDDCRLDEGALARFQLLLPSLWEQRDEWDIFNGGPTFIRDIQKTQSEPPLFKIKGYATHFCLVNKSAYDKILGFEEKEIDILYSENLRMVCTRPKLAHQEVGKSDVTNEEANYSAGFESADTELLKEGFQTKSDMNEFSLKFAMVCLVIAFVIHYK
jgi:hypothetical protein